MTQNVEPSNNKPQAFRVSFTPDEFVVLKELAAKGRKRFWRDYPLLISLCALLLSIGTTIVSAALGYRKDIHDQLAELSADIRILQDLNLKQIEVRDKYAGTGKEAPAIALMSNQIYNTTMMAAEIIYRIGTYATTASIIPVSQGVYHYGQYSRAEALAQIGLSAARTAEDETTALRWLALIRINEHTKESINEGNKLFLRAFSFEESYGPGRDPDVTSFIKAGVQLDWARALAPVDCRQAQKHYSEVEAILKTAGHPGYLETLRTIVKQAPLMGIGNVKSCVPATSITGH